MDILEKMEMEFQKIHSKLSLDLSNKIIYHYTNFDGFENIIKEKTLRYTDYQCFNDPTEIKFGSRLIFRILLHRKVIFPEAIDFTFDLFNEFEKFCHLYIACFSEEIQKLSLWRYYALNGSGVAIGFNKNFHGVGSSVGLEDAVIGKVKYGIEEAIPLIDEFIDAYSRNKAEKLNLSMKIECFCKLISHLISVIPLLKE